MLFVAPGLKVAMMNSLDWSLKLLCEKDAHENCCCGFDQRSMQPGSFLQQWPLQMPAER